MLKYIIPFLAYIGIVPLLSLFNNPTIGYVLKVIVTGILILYYLKQYTELKQFKINYLAILTGLLIFIIWISLEGFYPRFAGEIFNPQGSIPLIILKLIGFILIAPLIEELFTKSFLLRVLIKQDFEKVPIGKFTWLSFIITVLFFGLAHNLWLPGIITGILLNLLLYKTKDIWACIQAHLIANIAVAIYVLSTSNWLFW